MIFNKRQNKTKNQWTENFFFNLQNHPTFLSVVRLVILVRGRECFVGLVSISLFYACVLVQTNWTVLYYDSVHCAKPASVFYLLEEIF